jgi:hypothetical protein
MRLMRRLRIGSQCIEQVAMAGKAYSAQIEAGFGDTAGEHSYFGMGLCPGDFACQHVQLKSPMALPSRRNSGLDATSKSRSGCT